MTAKLVDEKRRSQFKVGAAHLYGDIITDEAADFRRRGHSRPGQHRQEHAMFEAIHGSAPRMVKEGRPVRRQHHPRGGHAPGTHRLRRQGETASKGPGHLQPVRKEAGAHRPDTGATGSEYAQYVMDTVSRDDLDEAPRPCQIRTAANKSITDHRLNDFYQSLSDDLLMHGGWFLVLTLSTTYNKMDSMKNNR